MNRKLTVLVVVMTCWSSSALAQSAPPTTPPASEPIPVLPAPLAPAIAPSLRRDLTMFDLFAMEGRDNGRSSRLYTSAVTFARCSVHLGQSRAVEIFRFGAGSSNERRAVVELVSRFRGCVSGSSAMPVRLIRGAVAEAIVMRMTAKAAFPDRAKTVDSERYLAYKQMVPATPSDDRFARLQSAAQCQVMLAPGLVRRVFDTKPGSDAEARSLDKVYDTVPVCAGSKRPEAIISPVQRAALAEAFYFWIATGRPLTNA